MATTKKATAAKTAKKDETAEMAAAAKAAAQAAKTAKAESAKAETKKTEAKTAEAAVKEEKKAPAKKAPAKKAAPKKVAPKKPAAVAASLAAPAETKVNFFVEFAGVQVSIDEVVKNVKATYGKDAKEISVYLKPEESKAYFVADGEEKQMDVYFC